MKLKFDWQHIGMLLFYIAIVALFIFEHLPSSGSPSTFTRTEWVGLAAATLIFVAALFKRSPADLWSILQGELLQVTSVLNGGTPPATPPASPTIPAPPPGSAGFATGRAIVVVLAAGALVGMCLLLPRCNGNSPAKLANDVAVVGSLGDQVECVFTKADTQPDGGPGESPEQAAQDCGVNVNDVFKVISLFNKRAAARKLCIAPDGGTP